MVDFNEMFGIPTSNDEDEEAEGLAAGMTYANWILEEIGRTFASRSAVYRAGVLEGLKAEL